MGATAARALLERAFYIYYAYYAYHDCDLYKCYFYSYYYCASIFLGEYEFLQEVVCDIVQVSVDADRRSDIAAALGTWGSCSAIEYQFS